MVRINLLPVRVSKKKEAGKQQLLLLFVLLLGGLAVNWIWHSARERQLDERVERVKKLNADIAALDKIIGEVKTIRERQEELKRKLDVLEKLKQGRSGPVKMLEELAGITPKRLWLTKLTEKDGKVVFDGSAITIEDVSEFMRHLKSSRFFTAVELQKTTSKKLNAYRVVDFTITATARYTSGPEVAAAKAGG